jgi:hypothetical protein
MSGNLAKIRAGTPEYGDTRERDPGRWPVRVTDEVDFFFNLPNPSSQTTAPGSTQPITEISTRNLPGGKKWPARRADNLAYIFEPIV